MRTGQRPQRFQFARDRQPIQSSMNGSVYLTAFFRAFPALKRTTRRFGTLIAAPVCGLRAVRAFRCDVLKVPKPTKVIESPFLRDFVMPSNNESTAAAALAFDEPMSLAILVISSCLFIERS